jgi:hypothetical protein
MWMPALTVRWPAFIVACIFSTLYVGAVLVIPEIQLRYSTQMSRLGFIIHTITGSVWLIFGGLQFFSSIRTKYPKAHRVMGTVALISMLISTCWWLPYYHFW